MNFGVRPVGSASLLRLKFVSLLVGCVAMAFFEMDQVFIPPDFGIWDGYDLVTL